MSNLENDREDKGKYDKAVGCKAKSHLDWSESIAVGSRTLQPSFRGRKGLFKPKNGYLWNSQARPGRETEFDYGAKTETSYLLNMLSRVMIHRFSSRA